MEKNITKNPSQNMIKELVILYKQGKLNDVINKAKSLIIKFPESIFVWNMLGLASIGIKKLNEAEKCFKTLTTLKPDSFEGHYNLGNVQYELGKNNEAILSYKYAIKLKPDFAGAQNNLGNVKKDLGKYSEAISSFTNAIEIKPDIGQYYNNYMSLVKVKYDDPILKKLEKLILKKDMSEENKIFSSFAMAKSQLDLNRFDKGFKFLNFGNLLGKKKNKYTIEKSQNLFSKIIYRFKELNFKEYKFDNFSNTQPIFILGMPRSGTTLVEQILSSHPSIYGAGELDFLNNIVNSIDWQNSNIEKKKINKIRKEYFIQLNKISKFPYITDKMPLNFQWIGFIAYAFPEAKIVHLKRDPMAVCWSNYKIHFKSKEMAFSFNQKDIAEYYKLYENLMKFWHKQFPNKIYDLNYEALTENFKQECQKLFDYLKIEWDESVINFHKKDRAVKTASNVQIRKKIYQNSSKDWKKYKNWLKTMINNLNKN